MDNKYSFEFNKQEMPGVLTSCVSIVPFTGIILSLVKLAKQGQGKDKENQGCFTDGGLQLRGRMMGPFYCLTFSFDNIFLWCRAS